MAFANGSQTPMANCPGPNAQLNVDGQKAGAACERVGVSDQSLLNGEVCRFGLVEQSRREGEIERERERKKKAGHLAHFLSLSKAV